MTAVNYLIDVAKTPLQCRNFIGRNGVVIKLINSDVKFAISIDMDISKLKSLG